MTVKISLHGSCVRDQFYSAFLVTMETDTHLSGSVQSIVHSSITEHRAAAAAAAADNRK